MAEPRNKLSGGDRVQQLLGVVRDLLRETRPGTVPSVDLDSAFDRDLGLDSLARMELWSRVEKRFKASLTEEAFVDAATPRDLLRALAGAGALRDPRDQERIRAAEKVGPEGGHYPENALTLPEVLDWHVERHPERSHVRFYADEGEGEVISFHRLQLEARQIAAGLQECGVGAGARVAIMLPTSPDYLFAFFGILLAGGVPVPIYPPLRKTQLESHLRRQAGILDNCGAVLLITLTEALAFARLLRAQLPALKRLVTVPGLREEGGAFRRPAMESSDTAFLQYTSGSTGSPKGVVLSHANLLANIRIMGRAVAVGKDDVIVSWLPLYHDMGLIGSWLSSLYHAVPLVLLSPLDFLTGPKRWLWALHRYRGTLSPAPNFAYEICLAKLGDDDLAGLDLSAWRGAFNGAEPVSPETLERFCARLAPYGFRREAMTPVYGLAECSVGLAFPPLHRGPRVDRISRQRFVRSGEACPAQEGEDEALRFVACGRPLPEHEIRIVDPSGRELPDRREGSVQFRGPSACGGYFRNPEATRRLFAGEWLETGDLGYFADGELYLTGRSKDIVIIAGRNIYPQELEEAVGNLAGVRKGNVAVFGSPDPRTGSERLVVVAEIRETGDAARERLRKEINALAAELTGNPPDELVLAPPQAVLKTSSGKIRRTACRELFEQGALGRPQVFWRQMARLGLTSLGPWLRRALERVASTLYAGYLWGLYGLGLPPAVLSLLLPRRSWRWAAIRQILRLLKVLSRLPIGLQGLGNLPRQAPCVIVANHASYLDSYLLAGLLPVDLCFVAKESFARRPLLGWLMRRVGTEFVERFDLKKGAEDARSLSSLAASGRRLLFFPEGTFTRVPGLLPFRLGAFVAAAQAGVPVVPVAIRGTRQVLRSESWFPRYARIGVRVGAPIAAESGRDAWQAALGLRDGARSFILRYCGEADLGGGEEVDNGAGEGD